MNIPDNAYRNAEIIRRRRAGEMPTEIVEHMGLSRNVIAGVLNRAGLCDPSTDKRPSMILRARRGEDHRGAKLTNEIVREIRRLYRPRTRGSGAWSIADKLGVSRKSVENVLYAGSWAHVSAEVSK